MGRGKSPVHGQEIKLIGQKYEKFLLVQHSLRRELEEELARELERYKLDLAKSVALCVGDNNKMARIADHMGVSHTTAQKYYQMALDNDLLVEAIQVRKAYPFTFVATHRSEVAISASDGSEFPKVGVRLKLKVLRTGGEREVIVNVNALQEYKPRFPQKHYPSVQSASSPYGELDYSEALGLLLDEKNLAILADMEAWFDATAALDFLRTNPTPIEGETI